MLHDNIYSLKIDFKYYFRIYFAMSHVPNSNWPTSRFPVFVSGIHFHTFETTYLQSHPIVDTK